MKILPVIWKLLISNINMNIAVFAAVLGNGCFINIWGIYAIMSLVRVLTYKQCAWFLNIDKRIVSRSVFGTILLLWLIFNAPSKVYKLLYKDDLSEYLCFLTSKSCKKRSALTRHIPSMVAMVIFALVSFVNEIYIGIKAGIKGLVND